MDHRLRRGCDGKRCLTSSSIWRCDRRHPRQLTDKYFTNTRLMVEANGDAEVTYAVFLRRRSIAALDAVVRLVERLVPAARVKRFYQEGEIVPAERKMLEITGPMSRLSAVETLMLQKAGIPSVAPTMPMRCASPSPTPPSSTCMPAMPAARR